MFGIGISELIIILIPVSILVIAIIITRRQSQKNFPNQSMNWFYFYTYFRLPIGALLTIPMIVDSNYAFYSFILTTFVLIQIIVIIGLHNRSIWGWNLNLFLITFECFIYSMISSKGDYIVLLMMFLIYMLVWFLPNFIYFKKRIIHFSTDSKTKKNNVDYNDLKTINELRKINLLNDSEYEEKKNLIIQKGESDRLKNSSLDNILELKEKGILTEEEYLEKKQIILSKWDLSKQSLLHLKIRELHQKIILSQKKLFSSNSAELTHIISEICISKEAAVNLIIDYKTFFSQDLIDDLKKVSSSFAMKKELLEKFIEFEIVNSEYPHERL